MRRTTRLVWLVGFWAMILWAGGSLGVSAEKSVEFDAKPILEHNEPWLHPDFQHLKSVSFIHAVKPVAIKERFAWRADGSSFVEVLQRELVSHAVGKVSVTTPAPALHYFAPGSDYAEQQARPDQGFDRLIRDFLMGTRTNFVALDWGWAPEQFTVRDVRLNDDGLLVVQLVPDALEYHINAGATFHTGSSAYVSKYRIGWGELTIDPNSRRILREVDYSGKGEKSCEIEFSDWKTVNSDQEVPQHIQLHLAYRNGVDIDYRFQWKDEGLWILANGRTQFQDKAPTLQEIQDLKINQPVPVLDEMLARVEESTRCQQMPANKPENLQLKGLHRFLLGKKATVSDAPAASPVESVLFTFVDDDKNSKWPLVAAQIQFDSAVPHADSGAGLLLTFLDKQGLPLLAQRAPLAALLNSDRTFTELGTAVAEQNSPWLSPDEKPSQLTYTFVSGENSKEFTVDDETTDLALRHGISLHTDWAKLANASDRFHAPVQFNGLLEGRPVVVSALPEWVYLSWSNGLKQTSHPSGYHSKQACFGLVVVEKETSRPIMSKYDDVEIYFQDYVQLESGRSAPLRIVIFQDDNCYDFRFQILNDRWWLFDRSYWNGEIATHLENILVEGNAPEITARAPQDVTSADQLQRLDWSRITDRTSTHPDETQLVLDVIERPQPWEHPSYNSLLKTQIAVDESAQQPTLTLHVNRSYFYNQIGYWSLAWCAPDAPTQHFLGPEMIEVPSYPANLDETIVADAVPQGSTADRKAVATRLHSYRLQRDEANWHAELEIVSHDRMVGILAPAAVALVDPSGQVQAAASQDFHFVIRDGIYADKATVPLGRPATAPKGILLGLKARITSAPMGSFWGTFTVQGPAFSYEQMLSADDSRVLRRAARWLYGELQENGLDRRGLERTWRDRSSARIDLLKPHLDQFAHLLERTEDAETLWLVARLAGHSRAARFQQQLAPLLEHEDENVRDAAAIGLGLLADPRGIDRLPSVLRRPMPEDKKDWVARQAVESWQTDAALALATIGTNEALQMLADALLESTRELRKDTTEKRETLVGPVATAEICIHVLGRTKSPIALDVFRKTLALPLGSKLAEHIVPHLSRWEDKDAIRAVFLDGIRRGDPAFIDDAPRDPAITEAMVEALTQLDLSDGAAWHAVRYLGFAPEPIALQALIDTYENKQLNESRWVRLELIEMLAERKGDYRGLAEAFQRLCEAVDTSTLPEDPKERTAEERNRSKAQRNLLDLVTRKFPVDVVAEFLRPHSESEDPNVQQAVERILAKSDAIRTAISTPPVVFPASVKLLNHVGEKAAGTQSYGGRGFAVKFTRPESADHVFAVEFFASRYGYPQAPADDFHIYLLDQNQKLIQDTPIPYDRVQRGNEKWYRFVVPPTEVPREFFLGLWFNAHQTKGISVGKNSIGAESHSYTGTLEKGYEPVTDQVEWMVRVRVAPKDVAAKLAVDLAPKPAQPSIPAPLLASKEDQEKARKILSRVAQVNHYWLFNLPPDVKNFSYSFRFGNEKPTEFEVDTKTSGGGSVRQGISYYSPLHRLARDPSTVLFRRVDVDGEKVTLAYILPEPMRVAMGTGLSGSWRGYFSTSVKEGKLIIDTARFVPLQHSAGELSETWSDFARQDAEHLAPSRIDIDRRSMQMHWNFQLWKPGLWLFASADKNEPADDEPPIASVDKVRVNGEEALILEGLKPAPPRLTD